MCVLLSTFNGEKYLRELLDSVLHQSGVDVHVLIRDDGSSDGTMGIVAEYQAAYPNVSVLTVDGTANTITRADVDAKTNVNVDANVNLGPANSFMELLYKAGEFDYYAFADQDDIWMPDKLAAAVRMLEQRSSSQLLLYCSNQTIFEDGVAKGLRYSREPNHSVTQVICANHISGTTLVMNRALREFLAEPAHRPDPEMLRRRMHDVWVVLIAQMFGKVIYDPQSYMLYRIHEKNQVGLNYDNAKNGLADSVGYYLDKSGKGRRSVTAREALKLVHDHTPEDLAVVEAFVESGDGLGGRLRLIGNKTVRRDCEERRLLFVVKALLGWH